MLLALKEFFQLFSRFHLDVVEDVLLSHPFMPPDELHVKLTMAVLYFDCRKLEVVLKICHKKDHVTFGDPSLYIEVAKGLESNASLVPSY